MYGPGANDRITTNPALGNMKRNGRRVGLETRPLRAGNANHHIIWAHFSLSFANNVDDSSRTTLGKRQRFVCTNGVTGPGGCSGRSLGHEPKQLLLA